MKPFVAIVVFSITLFSFCKVFAGQTLLNSQLTKNQIMHFDDLFFRVDSFIAPKHKLVVNGSIVQTNVFFRTPNVQFGNISFEELIMNPLEVDIRGDIYYVKLAKK